MSTIELQNRLIRRILDIKDQEILKYLYGIIGKERDSEYSLTAFEKQVIQESLEDYITGKVNSNEEVFEKTKKWLDE